MIRVPEKTHRGPRLFAVRGSLSPRADLIIGFGGLAALLAAWCIVSYGGFVRPLFLPTPTGMLEGLAEFHRRGWLLPAILRSFQRVTIALFWVTAIGVPIGILMGALPPVDAFLRKIINGAKSVPTTGLLGLVVLWIGIEEQGKMVFLFLGAIFYMIILVKNAVLSVNPDYIRVAVDMGANPRQTITRVLLPGALPQIWDAIAVCNGIMWTYIVLTEFINSNESNLGIGFLLSIGSKTNESGQVFAALLVIAAISTMTDWVLTSIRRRFFNW